jgi:hypothetical protein
MVQIQTFLRKNLNCRSGPLSGSYLRLDLRKIYEEHTNQSLELFLNEFSLS